MKKPSSEKEKACYEIAVRLLMSHATIEPYMYQIYEDNPVFRKLKENRFVAADQNSERIAALERQVKTLTEQVAGLKGETQQIKLFKPQ